MAKVEIIVNGTRQSKEVEDRTLLVNFLRDVLGLTGTHIGCDTSQCGSCTVHVDGAPRRSCVTAVSTVAGKEVVTLEGLGTPERPHPLQQAFIDEQAAQCGYCINGMIMTTKALLDKNPKPSEDQIKQALAGNLCRCGAHIRILRAVKRASGQKV